MTLVIQDNKDATLDYRLSSIALPLCLETYRRHRTVRISRYNHLRKDTNRPVKPCCDVVQTSHHGIIAIETTPRCNQIPIRKLHHEDRPPVPAVSFLGAYQTPAS